MTVKSKELQSQIKNVSSYLEQLKETIEERQRLIGLKLTPSQSDNLEIVEVLSRIKRSFTYLHEDLTGDHIKKFGTEYTALVADYGEIIKELEQDAYIEVSEYEFSDQLPVEEAAKKSVRFKDFEADDDDHTQMRNELMGTASNNFKPYTDEEPDRNTLLSVDTTNQEMFAQHQQQILEQDQNLDQLHQSISTQHSMGVGISQELDNHLIMLGDLESQADRSLSGVRRATTGVANFRRKVAENGSLSTIIVLTVILILLLVVLN